MEKYFDFLDGLRDSGEILDSVNLIMAEFKNLELKQAEFIIGAWALNKISDLKNK